MRSIACQIAFILLIWSVATSSFGSNRSIGQDGINSVDIPRSGAGIGIGQVEIERPGVQGVDAALNYNSSVDPVDVFLRDGIAPANMDVEPGHATEVASVMISTDTTDDDEDGDNPRGVALDAELYASAIRVLDEEDTAVSAQHVANQNGGDVEAINFSFLQLAFDPLDGSSLITQFVDWSAITHDVLYVISGAQDDSPGFDLPTDNFNGITVAMSTLASDGVYRSVDSRNRYDADALGDRTSVDLVAPGDDIVVATRGSAQSNMQATRDGTSFAAPHVTGTVALLQEEAANMSAIAGNHTGAKWSYLGSWRTVVWGNRSVASWTITSQANVSPFA